MRFTDVTKVYFKDGQLEVVICSSKENMRNFYTGNWRSLFTVSLSQNSAELSGVIKLHAHYFEGKYDMLFFVHLFPFLEQVSDG